jgi:hypothetical protein
LNDILSGLKPPDNSPPKNSYQKIVLKEFPTTTTGIDFAKLHFGRKLFGHILRRNLWTYFHPKTTDIN